MLAGISRRQSYIREVWRRQRSNRCTRIIIIFYTDDEETRLYHIITDRIRFQFGLRIFELPCT